MVDCSIARASSSCRMRLLISAILRCSCSVSARMKLRGLYYVEAKKAWTNTYRVPCPADKMPKRWRRLSLAGFQKELYVAYRKGIYFRSPFDSKNHKELSYRSVTLSAYILHMRVLLERARYMKLRLPERNTHPVASSARYPSILPLLSAFASFDWEIPWNYRRAWNWIRGKGDSNEFLCIPHPIRHLPEKDAQHQILVIYFSHNSILNLPQGRPPPPPIDYFHGSMTYSLTYLATNFCGLKIVQSKFN